MSRAGSSDSGATRPGRGVRTCACPLPRRMIPIVIGIVSLLAFSGCSRSPSSDTASRPPAMVTPLPVTTVSATAVVTQSADGQRLMLRVQPNAGQSSRSVRFETTLTSVVSISCAGVTIDFGDGSPKKGETSSCVVGGTVGATPGATPITTSWGAVHDYRSAGNYRVVACIGNGCGLSASVIVVVQ